jgi:hypothetical protein
MPNWRELERRPVNARFFDHLDEPDVAQPDPTEGLMTEPPEPDPYMNAGSHPDCVERVWDDIGATLPEDCRFVIRGHAVLAHPISGFVFAMPYGTEYALWIPEPEYADAAAAGLVPTTTWSTGESTDLTAELGDGWLFGEYKVEELAWVAAAYVAAVQ